MLMRVHRTFADLAFGTPRRRHKGQRRHSQHALRDSAARGASTGRVAFSDSTHDGERATGFTTIGINRHRLAFLLLRNQSMICATTGDIAGHGMFPMSAPTRAGIVTRESGLDAL
jgi:hypothetical protein